MRLSHRISYSLLAGLLGVSARSPVPDQIQEHLSFGQYGHHVWTDDHKHVTGFTLSGDHGHHPELMSDRIVLTPVWPGNKRASVWADYPQSDETWSLTSEFRVSGGEHGSGNLQFWFVKNSHDIGTSSIYTVGKFDGLAIVIDQYGGHGSIRGFLNDGSTSYKDHHHVDSLPFGHCSYGYRNTGHYLSLEVKQTAKDFEVNIDGHRCFHSKKIKTHAGNHYGITAASAEHPDSIEIKSFTSRSTAAHHDAPHGEHHDYHDPNHYASAGHHDAHAENQHIAHPHHEAAAHVKDPKDQYSEKDWYWVDDKAHVKDVDAETIKTDKGRFADLHDRVQLLNHQVDALFHDLSLVKEQQEDKHKEVLTWLTPIHDYIVTNKYTLERMEVVIEQLKKDVEGTEFKEHLEALSHLVAESHQTIMHGLPQSLHTVVQGSSRLGFFVFIIIASQVMLLGSYMIYRSRLDRQPKKYL